MGKIKESLLPWLGISKEELVTYKEYASNAYLSYLPDFENFECLMADLTNEYEANRMLKRLRSSGKEEALPAVIDSRKIYFVDELLTEHLNCIHKNSVSTIKLSNTTQREIRIVGRLVYGIMDYSLQKDYKTSYILSQKEYMKRVVFKDDSDLFVKVVQDQDRKAQYVARRGLRVKVHAGIFPGKILVFFTPEGSHEIKVFDYSGWINKPVKVKSIKYKQELGLSDNLLVKSIREDGKVVVYDQTNNKEYLFDSNQIYIPASSRILAEVGVFDELLRFTSFQDMGEDIFLEKALNDIFGKGEEISLKYKNRVNIKLNKIMFKISEDRG